MSNPRAKVLTGFRFAQSSQLQTRTELRRRKALCVSCGTPHCKHEMFPRRESVNQERNRQNPIRSVADSSFPNNSRLAAFTSEILIVNPAIGLLQSCAERGVGFPSEILLNERVIAVAAVDPFGRA